MAALIFAMYRTPYDDEWYSLELATVTDWEQFWRSVQNDLHPPWVALLDRGIAWLGGGRALMHCVRIAATAMGITLVARIVKQHLSVPTWVVAVAGFHPVVLMYDLLVADYARVGALLQRACRPEVPVLHLPSPRHSPNADAQLANLRAALGDPGVEAVRFVRRVHAPSSLALTHRRVEDLLEARCQRAHRAHAVVVPHSDLRALFRPASKTHYLQSELWTCVPGEHGKPLGGV